MTSINNKPLDWLFLNPRPKYNVLGDYDPLMVPFAPMGLAYLAAVLGKKGFDVSIYDDFVKNRVPFVDILRLKNPAVVGISCLTPVMGILPHLSRLIRNNSPYTKIVLGNIHPTLFAKQLLKNGLGDIIVRGEAEETVGELADCLAGQGDLANIRGISYLDQDQIIENSDRDLVRNLDDLPLPAWHLVDIDQYKTPPMFSFNKRLLPLLASRGCPFRCYFCAQNVMSPKIRKRNPALVADEVASIYNKTGINMFWFADAIFPLTTQDAETFCREITKKGLHNKIRWITETRADLIDRPLIRMMKKAGLYMLIFGLESGDQDLLTRMKPGLKLADGKKAVSAAKTEKVLSLGLFMLGLPGETEQSIIKTIDYAKRSGLDFAKFNIAVPYPGSQFFQDVFRNKTIPAWENFSANYQKNAEAHDLVYTPDGMSSRQLEHWQKKAFFRFYIRPKLILRHFIKGNVSPGNMLLGGGITIKNYLINGKKH